MAGYSNTEFTSKKFDIIGDDDFVGKVKVLLDEVWALKDDLGKEFLRELDGTPHMIGIKKGNNTTSVSGENQYYKLIAAFRKSDWTEARQQLQNALTKSFYRPPDVLTKLAKQLVTPTSGIVNYAFTAAQIEALDNAGITFGAPKQAQIAGPGGLVQKQNVTESQLKSVEKQWTKALTKFLAGGKCVFTAAEQYTLVARKLETWLERGERRSRSRGRQPHQGRGDVFVRWGEGQASGGDRLRTRARPRVLLSDGPAPLRVREDS